MRIIVFCKCILNIRKYYILHKVLIINTLITTNETNKNR